VASLGAVGDRGRGWNLGELGVGGGTYDSNITNEKIEPSFLRGEKEPRWKGALEPGKGRFGDFYQGMLTHGCDGWLQKGGGATICFAGT